jgi:hypothetical protein
MDKTHKTFICAISNVLGTDSENLLVYALERNFGAIKTIFTESEWSAPAEYVKEMGNGLNTKVYVFEKEMWIGGSGSGTVVFE